MDPSLGDLSRLPRELRDTVYIFALEPATVDVESHSCCQVHNLLHSVSRKLRIKSSCVVKRLQSQPCKHTKLSFLLPPLSVPNESITTHGAYNLTNTSYSHNVCNTKRLRFLTGHLGNDVPLAIAFNFDLPERVTYAIFGASAWTEKALYEHLDKFVNVNVYNAQHFAFGPRSWVRAKGIEDLGLAVRMAVCRAG